MGTLLWTTTSLQTVDILGCFCTVLVLLTIKKYYPFSLGSSAKGFRPSAAPRYVYVFMTNKNDVVPSEFWPCAATQERINRYAGSRLNGVRAGQSNGVGDERAAVVGGRSSPLRIP